MLLAITLLFIIGLILIFVWDYFKRKDLNKRLFDLKRTNEELKRQLGKYYRSK